MKSAITAGAFVLIVVAVFAVASGVAYAATTVTVGVGQQYATIQQGVTAGDIVQVYPGTYDESITVSNKAVTVEAVKGPVLTKIIGSGNGFTTSGTGAVQIQGFSIVKSNNAVLSGGTCNVYNCILTGMAGSGYATTTGADASGVVNCLVMDCGTYGIYAHVGGAIIGVRNCVIQSNLGYGAYSYPAGCLTSDYNCYFHNQSGDFNRATGAHDLLDTDPQFRDPSHWDYRLKESPASPCIDMGDVTPGMQDPDGTRSDIGLYGGHYCASFWYGPLNGPAVRGVIANPPVVQYGGTFRIEGTAEIK